MTRLMDHGRPSKSVFLAGAVLLVAVAAVFPRSDARAATKPSNGVLLGAYVRRTGGLSFVDAEQAFETQLGRKLAIVNKYHDWSDTNYSDEAQLVGSGHLVMISWHPTDNLASDTARASKVASGQYDALIRRAAKGLKALGGRVLLRWDFEMGQDPGQPEYIGPPAQFKAAWRHMHDIFRKQKARNVKWVWAPQTASFSDGTAPSFYPGKAYVNWIGGSDVMGGHSFPTFEHTFAPTYAFGSARGKPMLAWFGVPENPSDPNWKADWFSGMRTTAETSMPALKAFVYYQAADGAGNFVADTTPQAWSAFQSMALDPYFNPA